MTEWILDRVKEVSTKYGAALVVGGIVVLVAPGLVKLVAFAAIGLGAYSIVKKDKEV